MAFVEQPDRFGRTVLYALGLWSSVAVLVYVAFTIANPSRHTTSIEIAAPPPCAATVPTAPYMTVGDPAARVLGKAPRCDAAVFADPDPTGSLRAYLDGAELRGNPTKPAPVVDAALRARGAELFARHCMNCHGPGDGVGPNLCALDPRPAVFRRGVYALRTTEHEALPTDDDLFRTISRGIHGTAMPPWFALPERDRWALVAHLKTLSTQFDEDTAPPPVAIGPMPVITAERLAHGRALYKTAGCASCHGDSGNGDGPAAPALAVKPRAFTRGQFHRGSSTVDIYTTIVTGLDTTPMASFAKVLHDDELWDVSAYVHELAPPSIERDGVLCARSHRALDPQELFGIRNLMTTIYR